MTEEEVEIMYRHFGRSLPLGTKFMGYTEDDRFLKSSLDSKRLYEVK